MKKIVLISITLLFLIAVAFPALSFAKRGMHNNGPQWANSGVQWEYKGVNPVDGSPAVKHYKWESERPPFGPFDKIALHRMVMEPRNHKMIPERPAPNKRKVLFIIPGTWSNGYSERTDLDLYMNLFFALNGYDVYSMDFRT